MKCLRDFRTLFPSYLCNGKNDEEVEGDERGLCLWALRLHGTKGVALQEHYQPDSAQSARHGPRSVLGGQDCEEIHVNQETAVSHQQ